MAKIICIASDMETQTNTICTEKLEKDSLVQLQRLIGCNTVSCHTITLDGMEYDVWYDDNYMGKNKSLTWVDIEGGDDNPTVLCGNIVFAHCDSKSNTVGINLGELLLFPDMYTRHMESAMKKFIPWYKNIRKNAGYEDMN